MAHEGISDRLLPHVPHLYVVVDASGIKLVAGFGERDCSDGEIRFYVVERSFLPRIPELRCDSVQGASWSATTMTYANISIVRCADNDLFSAPTDIQAIDHFLVSRVLPYPLSGLEVPACQMHIRRSRVDYSRVARPLYIEDCSLVSLEEPEILAIPVRIPQH